MSRIGQFAAVWVAAAALLVALGVASGGAVEAAPEATITACVGNAGGQYVRIVDGPCLAGEHAASWNVGDSGPVVNACVNNFTGAVRIFPGTTLYGVVIPAGCQASEHAVSWRSDGTGGGASGCYNRWIGTLSIGRACVPAAEVPISWS